MRFAGVTHTGGGYTLLLLQSATYVAIVKYLTNHKLVCIHPQNFGQ